MRCTVPLCKNDHKNLSKSEGISFHIFPMEPSIRDAWLRAVGKGTDWVPKLWHFVCSDHFSADDMYTTKAGLRKIKFGGVPTIKIPSDFTIKQEDIGLKACRICLNVGVKLCSMDNNQLDVAYQDIIGIEEVEEDLPYYVCVDCGQRLLNFDKFKKKCMRSYSLLRNAINENEELTMKDIRNINRYTNSLSSNLCAKRFEPDHFDVIIVEYDGDNDVDEMELKSEVTLDHDYNNVLYDEDLVKLETESVEEFTEEYLDEYTRDEEQKTIKVRIRDDESKIEKRRKTLGVDLDPDMFSITELTFEEQVAEIQNRKESANYRNGYWKCNLCFKGYIDENAYRSHLIRHSNKCGEYECEVCKLHFRRPHAVRHHITTCHKERYSCKLCPYIGTQKFSAQMHEKWHKGTVYQCEHCFEVFDKATTYKGHLRLKHPSDFVCELCGYSFVSQKGIDIHKTLKHKMDNCVVPDDGPLCEECNIRFATQEAYDCHLKVTDRHYKSTGVKRTNRPQQKLKRRKHRNDDEDGAESYIPCEQCGVKCESALAYYAHFRRMHPDKNRTIYPTLKTPLMCEQCGKIFQTHTALTEHSWSHTGEKPFVCPICDKAFRTKCYFKLHTQIHSEVRPNYRCEVCCKNFSSPANRLRHMTIHTGEMRYECEVCKKRFKQGSELKSHYEHVHLKKPWPKRNKDKKKMITYYNITNENEASAEQPIWLNCDQFTVETVEIETRSSMSE